jgi:hypothetical protein
MGGRTTAACGGVVALVARRRGFEHFAEDIEIWPSAHRRVVAKARASDGSLQKCATACFEVKLRDLFVSFRSSSDTGFYNARCRVTVHVERNAFTMRL